MPKFELTSELQFAIPDNLDYPVVILIAYSIYANARHLLFIPIRTGMTGMTMQVASRCLVFQTNRTS
jgi:hypothetical protein